MAVIKVYCWSYWLLSESRTDFHCIVPILPQTASVSPKFELEAVAGIRGRLHEAGWLGLLGSRHVCETH